MIDPCLSLFAWAPSRSTQAAIKLHTAAHAAGLARRDPRVHHISDGCDTHTRPANAIYQKMQSGSQPLGWGVR